MTERQKFMAAIESLCGGSNARFVLHDWELYFRLGYRAHNAGEAFREAIQCE
ncbi:TPA: hypothetical protein ACIJ17_003577 [Klebsiella aerogenes]